MAAWTRRGMRLDIEVAVALELGKARMDKAASGFEREQALAFNRQLWAAIGDLAVTLPAAEGGAGLIAAARAVAAGTLDPVGLITLNVRQASLLAGRAATQGALKRLLEDWHAHRRADNAAEFGLWLLGRIEQAGALPDDVVSAAA